MHDDLLEVSRVIQVYHGTQNNLKKTKLEYQFNTLNILRIALPDGQIYI